uniref:Uncharacterized protein n=1 Tax=Sinocyclocheilus anshuiensis TaxID=1608454 RepID=A0A671QCX6_9TELE
TIKTSKSLIAYESGRIYFDNYRCCYSSLLPEPEQLYELPKAPKTEKIEDALLCQCPLDKVLPNASDQKSCLLVLTAHNWLYRLSADTGKTLERVYLSSHFKFRSLGWDSSQETLLGLISALYLPLSLRLVLIITSSCIIKKFFFLLKGHTFL